VLSFGIALGVVVGIWVLKPDLRQIAAYGYLGIFLARAISNATILIPVPGLFVALAAGGCGLDPWLVGLAGGTGAAVGEMTGFLAGFGGSAVLEEKSNWITRVLMPWFQRYGIFAVFGFAAVPNPIFDAGGLISGALKMTPWKFFLAAATGNIIKTTYIAYFGRAGIGMLGLWP
jgi:membrane protein DedA with SNARE-associated domain